MLLSYDCKVKFAALFGSFGKSYRESFIFTDTSDTLAFM
jgi:hypothetical protein